MPSTKTMLWTVGLAIVAVWLINNVSQLKQLTEKKVF